MVKNDSGVFSFHLNSLEIILAIDQWYQMSKSENFHQFKEALQLMGVPRFNIVYADDKDNIFYMSNAKIPLRDSIYNWSTTLPGNTSKTKTTAYFPYESLPMLQNPDCGYIFNTNNSPFNCTEKKDNFNYKEGLNEFMSNYSNYLNSGRRLHSSTKLKKYTQNT